MRIDLSLPTSWDQLKPKQLLFVSWLFLQGKERSDFLTRAFIFLSGLRPLQKSASINKKEKQFDYWYKHKFYKKAFTISQGVMVELVNRCKFLLEDVGEVNPLKRIRFARARDRRLYKSTFGEYLSAENWYFAYQTTQKEEYLDCLVACLYRPWWKRFDDSKVRKRSKFYRKVPIHVKYTVFLWYSGFRNYVKTRCPELFKETGEGGKMNVRDHITGMIRCLNDGDITKNKLLMKSPLWDALTELNQAMEAVKKLKSKN